MRLVTTRSALLLLAAAVLAVACTAAVSAAGQDADDDAAPAVDAGQDAEPATRHHRHHHHPRRPVPALPSDAYLADSTSLDELAAAVGVPAFTATYLGMHRESAVRPLESATARRIAAADPRALDVLERAGELAESAKRHAEILQWELATAAQAIKHVVDVVEHKHDYSALWNDIAAFFGIFVYIGGVGAISAALGKFAAKEIAIQVQPKENALDKKEFDAERAVLLSINDVVDAFYEHARRLLSTGHHEQIENVRAMFERGDADISSSSFQLNFRRRLVQRLLRGRYTVARCRSEYCVGHPLPDPDQPGRMVTFKSDLRMRQVKYMDEIQVDWWAVYHGLDGWVPKAAMDTYKCTGAISALAKRGHGVHCGGHWRDLLPMMRKVVVDGKVVRDKSITKSSV